MSNLFKNALKSAAMWFVTGVLFALAANAIAPSLGAGEIATLAKTLNPVWLGSLLGGTGAISTFATPVIDFLFGDKVKEPEDARSACLKQCDGRQVNINIQHAPSQEQNQVLAEGKFRQNLDTERLAEMISNTRTPGT